MIKNFTRIRQWAAEKLGSSHGTLPSEEFKDFQVETRLRHEDFDEMRHTVNTAIKHIPLKKNTNDGGHRRSLVGDFGESLVTHASMFPKDTVYWKMLTALGQGERQISEAEGNFADVTKDNYIALLRKYDQHYKEYQSLCRKLESRRLDYDAKYNRLQKAKKERPETEQCVQAAKVKYEETELDVVQSMIYLQEMEVDHCDALQLLLDSQLDYHRQAFDILERVKNDWDHWTENCSKTGFSPISTTPNQFANCDGKTHGNDRNKPTLRRALYDHVQSLDDELTFHVNDIITVLHKVDDGWWLGELVDKNNRIHRGIFPVNYTEPHTNEDDDDDNNTDGDDSNYDQVNPVSIGILPSENTYQTPDQIDDTANNDMKFKENNKDERDQGNRIDDDQAMTRHTTSKINETVPQHIDTQNIRSTSPSTKTPLSSTSSFVSPLVSSPSLPEKSGIDHPIHSQSKQSSLSSASSRKASAPIVQPQNWHEKTPTTPMTPNTPMTSNTPVTSKTPTTPMTPNTPVTSKTPTTPITPNTPMTPMTPNRQKLPAPPPPSSPDLSASTDTYCRPLPPIPLND
ncbi:hypothetical protein BCR42DRAFT_402102 [Absidia repens]|uniref:SH3 domain-containing protein n=1 Tax=Absidia repens TaxID=90262 RepID=A0A1X2IXI0_9FUNG|nr:hypothetical protein BCR42DRAFT_402102 [Absidia repens]